MQNSLLHPHCNPISMRTSFALTSQLIFSQTIFNTLTFISTNWGHQSDTLSIVNHGTEFTISVFMLYFDTSSDLLEIKNFCDWNLPFDTSKGKISLKNFQTNINRPILTDHNKVLMRTYELDKRLMNQRFNYDLTRKLYGIID